MLAQRLSTTEKHLLTHWESAERRSCRHLEHSPSETRGGPGSAHCLSLPLPLSWVVGWALAREGREEGASRSKRACVQARLMEMGVMDTWALTK